MTLKALPWFVLKALPWFVLMLLFGATHSNAQPNASVSQSAAHYSDIVLQTPVYQLINHKFLMVEKMVHQARFAQDPQTILENIK